MDWLNIAWEKIKKGPKKWIFLVGGGITAVGLATNRLGFKWLSSFCDAGTIVSLSGYSILKNIEIDDGIITEIKKLNLLFDMASELINE